MWISIVVLALMIPILAIFLDSDLGKALARRLERRRRKLGGETGLHERMTFLEGEVERLSDDVHRLEEESQFLQKLLEERSGADGRSGHVRKGS